MVYAVMGEAFEMFAPDATRRMHLLPNAKSRRIDLCVDALSSRNFRFLKYDLTRKAAKIGGAAFVTAMIEALKQFTVQHDYLHEIRIHQQDAIWKSKYGCFLQAFQIELGHKRTLGTPAKTNMQGHESFLLLVHTTMRILLFERFLQSHHTVEQLNDKANNN